MLAVPISFVSEHIETLEEMDMEYRELAMESGIQRRGHAPSDTPPRAHMRFSHAAQWIGCR